MSAAFEGRGARTLLAALGLWALVGACSVLLHGPMPLYSTRTLGVAWEMWLRGDFLVPHLNGAPYSHKTPLVYWLIHAGWAVGGVGDVWPRLLMVLLSTALLAATAALAARLHPARTGPARHVAWVLAGSTFLFLFSLQIMFEVALALGVVLALAALTPALERGGRARFGWFALALGAALLVKGPVAYLHVAFPLLLAPWWSPEARAAPGRWYGRVLLGCLGAAFVFALWLVPALLQGGERYADEVLWMQTAGRVVDAFDHARPFWWYFAIMPVLAFPWLYWPAWWTRLRALDGEPATRFLLAWLVPTFAAFCLVSAKQVYYMVPLIPPAALLLVRALDGPAPAHGEPRIPWSAAPVALAIALGGLALLLAHYRLLPGAGGNRWLAEFASANPATGAALLVLALMLMLPLRGVRLALVPRLGATVLLAGALGHAAFTETLWRYFDLEPVARVLAEAQEQGQPVATTYTYEGEYQFLGRLREPLVELPDPEVAAWAAAHPDGVLVTRPRAREASPAARPLFEAEFRERRVQVWRARDWLAASDPR